MQTIINADGHLVLPPSLMRVLSLKAGDAVTFEDIGDGRYVLTPLPIPRSLDIKALKGCVKYDGSPVSLADMEAAIAAHAGADS